MKAVCESINIRLRRMPSAPSIIFQKRRSHALDSALYMRPIRPIRIGHVNTDWSTDGWYRHGVPVNKSLILVLKCGHIEMAPQHPVKLRKLVHCPMCFRLWTERAETDRLSQVKQRKRKHVQEEIDVMAKKSKKKEAPSGRERGRTEYEFVKMAKDIEDETIAGVVYNAIKKLKSGTVAEVTDAAVKGGLKDVTGQDPMVQTGVWLNRLAAKGIVKKIKAEGKAAVSKAAKTVRFKLKKGKKDKAA